jgi:PAS domain S-box-containing protein
MNDNGTIWRSLIDRSRDGIVVVDQDGKVYESNQRYCEMLGYCADEMRELHVWDWDAQWTREQLLPMFRNDQDFRSALETRHRRKDGTFLDVEISSSQAVSDGRRLTFCICRDISARKQAEKALEASEARFRALIEKAPVAISLSRDGIGVYANPRYLEMVGLPDAGEFIGHALVEHSAPQCREAIQERSRRRAQGLPVPAEFETVFMRRDGSQFPVAIAVGEVQLADGAVIIAFVTDITERKRMEAELIRNQNLESLGVLAGGIAHDFNNILTSLVGNLSLLRADLPQDPALEELVDEAENAAQSGKGLAQQLLTFAKGGAPVKKTLDLARLLRDAAVFTLRGSGAACEFALAEGLWPVQADPGQMEQVVHNLVLNAEQAMAGRGVVSLRAANADLPEGRFVEVRVADQGTGIPAGDLAHIFEPYFTTKAKGHGLGLSIVHSIIECHGGRIAVDSQPGSGTEFRFLLPACAEAAEAPGRTPAPRRAAGRVLIMDDDPAVARILSRMLRCLGCESAAVPDGESALAAYAQADSSGRGFSLVIMDLTVPGRMGGKEAVSRLKEKHPQARVAVSSGYANDPVLAGFAEFGFDAVLVKPYRLEDVAKLLA